MPQGRGKRKPGRDLNDDIPAIGKSGLEPILGAVRFYSRLPVGGDAGKRPVLDHMAPLLPVAGLLIGLPSTIALAGLTLAGMPALFAAALALAVWVVVTGAMAEDGFADALDGLFGGATPERRLEILKDPRHGTYAVSGLALSFLARAAALAALTFANPIAGPLAWLGIGIASRSFSLWLPASMQPARTDGTAAVAGQLTSRSFITGAVIAGIAGFALCIGIAGPLGAVFALLIMSVALMLWRSLCNRLVGGYTGDLIGGGQLVLEIAALSFFMLWVR